MEQFVDNFSLLPSKKKRVDEEVEDVAFFNEEDKDKMCVVIERDIQEFKDTHMMY